jgi:hypothetical protein
LLRLNIHQVAALNPNSALEKTSYLLDENPNA